MSQILTILTSIYGQDADSILQKVIKHLNLSALDAVKARPGGNWHKFMELYCVYPDGIQEDATAVPLQNLKRHLTKVKALGCNAVHILPFLASPMVDYGFDVSDYYAIRANLGTLEDLQDLINEANRLDLNLVMDMVLNHVSDQHAWFKKAEAGDERYRHFFIHTQDAPRFIRKYTKNNAIWAEYEAGGQIFTANIIFPEHTGPIPHWRQGKDGYWYYHTFYPSQLDLNWFNPELFLELAKLLVYWAKYGFSFRFDAVHFIGLGPYKAFNKENKNAHALLTVLKTIVNQVNPHSVFIVEAAEPIEKVLPYFGTEENGRADMAYNFYVCNEVWAALASHRVEYIWRGLSRSLMIPLHGEWLYFLRNHDELSLDYLDEEQHQLVNAAIGKEGVDFREGCGISGRTCSLLGGDINRMLMAYFLIASFPGGMMIPYGDEIAKQNIALADLPARLRKDTRNINRGVVDASAYKTPAGAAFFEKMAKMINQRRLLREYIYLSPKKLPAPEGVFAACYAKEQSQLGIFINLSPLPKVIPFEAAFNKVMGDVNEAHLNGKEVFLGPYAGIWLI